MKQQRRPGRHHEVLLMGIEEEESGHDKKTSL